MHVPLTFEAYLDRVGREPGHRRPGLGTNAWLEEPGLRIYVRTPWPNLRPSGVDFELASLNATRPGKGALTRFLDRYEPQYGFYFENVLNDRLAAYLRRRGYTRFPRGADLHLYRPRGATQENP